ncbi:MAG: hypothetical protein L0Z62_46545 [Gemmataceae bacterium]|nr:hypothetical protein [Gemmataceae bacterium]
MDPHGDYLRIPEAYCRWLGGLRWSDSRDAIEYPDVGTFALTPEIALFLEGFGSNRPLIHFGFVLHLLHLLGYGKIAPPPPFLTLRKIFREGGRPVRNAGALCARLCDPIPDEPGDWNVAEICQRLAVSAVSVPYPTWFVDPFAVGAGEPPLNTDAFETRILTELERLRVDEIEHWLRHGCAPLGDVGDQVARQLVLDRPRLLGKKLAFLAQQPRLAGAVPFVAQLVSALALPPRRLAEPELATGGYADVATRGEPERLLPSQFALDEIEFIRRFAQNELLYFRREEPQAQTREMLVIVLDQGVRTWGVVRLVLSAAALAFGQLAARKQLPFVLAGTSSGGRPLDPLKASAEDLAALVQASDLSANPGLTLERVLEERSETVRDVVLLTHPRNLAEPDVSAAARRAGNGTRLFAVAVDEHGAARFSEVKHGVPMTLSQFQIVFPKTERTHAPGTPRTVSPEWEALPPWQGDVEPIGYPFRLGLSGPVKRHGLTFDAEGKWLLALTTDGLLHAFKIDGSWGEVLPRGRVGAAILEEPEAVLGVADGFVAIGRMAGCLMAAHYELSSRRCELLRLAPFIPNQVRKYFYFREYHTVVAQASDGGMLALDLSPSDSPASSGCRTSSPRAQRAWAEVRKYVLPPPRIPIGISNLVRPSVGPWVCLDRYEGGLAVEGVDHPWNPCVPLADGKPLLKGCLTSEAQCRGDILALTYCRSGAPERLSLLILRGPDGIPVCEYPYSPGPFVLSCDGGLLARQVGTRPLVQVHDLNRDAVLVFTTPTGKHHSNLEVRLGEFWMTVAIGKRIHLIQWDCGPLVLQHMDKQDYLKLQFISTAAKDWSSHRATKKECLRLLGNHSKRFVLAAKGQITLFVDKLGHLAVVDAAGELVCMFCFLREQVAAWMPDGTRYGPPTLSRGPAAGDALEKLGNALRTASELGRRMRP